MRSRLLYFTFLLLTAFPSLAQLTNAWRVNTDMGTFDRKQIQEAPSGNIVISRMDDYNGIGDGNDLVQSYTSDGTFLWSFGEEDFFDGSNSNFIDIDLDADGNIYLCGSNFPQNSLYPKSEIIKLSPSGEELWRINFTLQLTWSEMVYEIEITEDNRIFCLAQLFQDTLQSIGPVFIEISADGAVLQMQEDSNFEIGYSQLFAPGDGYLYAIDNAHIVKLDYNGNILWNTSFNFADGLQPFFPFQRVEDCITFANGKIYACLGLYDPMGIEQIFGIATFSLDGTIEQTLTYSILPEISSLFNVFPNHIRIDQSGNIFVVGTYSYDPTVGIQTPHGDDSLNAAERGGKGGSTATNSFITRIDNLFVQNWSIGYTQSVNVNTYTHGAFLSEERIAVVFNNGNVDTGTQRVECYDNATGAMVWAHEETDNGLFQRSLCSTVFQSSNGAIITAGEGINVDVNGTGSKVYLYRYDLLANGIEHSTAHTLGRMWPNPASKQVFVEALPAMEWLYVYDMTGKRVIAERITSSIKTLDVSTLSPGMYTLRQSGETDAAQKLIIE